MQKTGKPRPAVLRALGKLDPPASIEILNETFERTGIFKHDSWAATAKYQSTGGKQIVCKFNRSQSIFGLPMAWLGRMLARREAKHLQMLSDVALVPDYCGPVLHQGEELRCAVAHDYIEGHTLRMTEVVSATFCDELLALVQDIHCHAMAYVDLHKRENILVGDNGKPYIIDFQVSYSADWSRLGLGWLSSWILRQMQGADCYHLRKHLALLEPQRFGSLTACSTSRPWWIRLHRLVAIPFRICRRRLLVLIGVRRGMGRVESEFFAEDSFRAEQTRLCKSTVPNAGRPCG